MSVTRRYVWKLYPTRVQQDILHEQRKMMADLWNALKQRCEDEYRGRYGPISPGTQRRRTLTYYDLTNEITTLRHECPEWESIPAVTAHRVAKWLSDAYAAFFRRAKKGEAPGYPRWMRRERAITIPLGTMETTGWTLRQRNDNPMSWALHYKSVSEVKDRSTWMHARGRLPNDRNGDQIFVEKYRNGDIIWRDNRWWLSICVELDSRRDPGKRPTVAHFDCLEGIARVNGKLEEADDIQDIQELERQIDWLKSERDKRFPRGAVLSEGARAMLGDMNAEIAKLYAYTARRRKDFLHVWTTRVIARASELKIMTTGIREHTRSARGNKKQHGVNVDTVAKLNRHILAYAPAMAVQMLKYKAEEAGIRVVLEQDTASELAAGEKLVAAGKANRNLKRAIWREEWASSAKSLPP